MLCGSWRQGLGSDVGAPLGSLEADLADGFIGAGTGGGDVGVPCGDPEDTSAMGADLAVEESGAGVEHLDLRAGGGDVETVDGQAFG